MKANFIRVPQINLHRLKFGQFYLVIDSSANTIKGDVSLILSDEFFMKLLDVDKLYGANLNHGVKGFINTLVRRLKRVSSAAQK